MFSLWTKGARFSKLRCEKGNGDTCLCTRNAQAHVDLTILALGRVTPICKTIVVGTTGTRRARLGIPFAQGLSRPKLMLSMANAKWFQNGARTLLVTGASLLGTSALLVVTRTLLGAKGIPTRSKDARQTNAFSAVMEWQTAHFGTRAQVRHSFVTNGVQSWNRCSLLYIWAPGGPQKVCYVGMVPFSSKFCPRVAHRRYATLDPSCSKFCLWLTKGLARWNGIGFLPTAPTANIKL